MAKSIKERPQVDVIDEKLVQKLLYDDVGGERFTQDSPIFPDVWMAFAADPLGWTDLILTPVRGSSAALISKDLRSYLYGYRNRIRVDKDRKIDYIWPPLKNVPKQRPRLTNLPGRVAVRLYFDELMRIVLAMTPWWKPDETKRSGSPAGLRSAKDHPLFGFPDPDDGDEDEMTAALVKSLEDYRKPKLGRTRNENGDNVHAPPRPNVLWVVRLGGAIALSCDWKSISTDDYSQRLAEYLSGPATGVSEAQARVCEKKCEELSGLLVRAFLDLYRYWPVGEPPRADLLWSVHLNRDAEVAVGESALTVKADAARVLFEISCDSITWAVVDSGIDRTHRAFRNRASGESRVRLTLDFTDLRDLLDPEILGASAAGDRVCGEPFTITPEVKAEREKLVANLKDRRAKGNKGRKSLERDLAGLRKRICKGQEIDWGILEDFIVDNDPEPPINEHGTHVAGILGGDWRDDDDQPVMTGICPDIKLIDVRVMRADGKSDEFEVMAAIQYLRYRNSTAGFMDVHGANLSLSLRHDVANYACGSTPICEECAEAVALGMVIVAAAGNRGFVRYKTLDGLQEGYNTVSVTDPGNAEAVITVGATHRKRPHEYGVSYFSSRGPTGDGRVKPDLVAPGEKIKAPIPGGGSTFKDGTSMAAPHVSGAAAMLMARHKELIARPSKIKRVLCDTATDLGRERYFQGHGLLDILRALQSI
jgi:hypothetical protein